MSDNNNPQPLTHMTDSVTPQPTAQDYLTNAQSRISDIYSATLKAMRDIEEAKACLSDAPSPSNMEANMKKLIAFTWQQAMEWAQDSVDDELCRDVDINVYIDETTYGDLNVSVRGEIEQNINIGEHVEIELRQPQDIAERHEEVLKEFLLKEEQEAATSVTAEPVETSINLSKNNA
jgi:hypothetical protein